MKERLAALAGQPHPPSPLIPFKLGPLCFSPVWPAMCGFSVPCLPCVVSARPSGRLPATVPGRAAPRSCQRPAAIRLRDPAFPLPIPTLTRVAALRWRAMVPTCVTGALPPRLPVSAALLAALWVSCQASSAPLPPSAPDPLAGASAYVSARQPACDA
jgi:hypothetical protein